MALKRTHSFGSGMKLEYETVNVFTDRPFTGNALAVVYGVEDLTHEAMIKICQEFHYSETVFVLPPDDPSHTAKIRVFSIFTENGHEIPFAGHPSIGAASVIAWKGRLFGKAVGDLIALEGKSGLVNVSILRSDEGRVAGAMLVPPQALTKGEEVLIAEAASCLSVDESEIVTAVHQPTIVDVGGDKYVLTELKDLAALKKIDRNKNTRCRGAFVFGYARTPDDSTTDLRCRSTCDGFEDAGSGSPNSALIAMLAGLESGTGTLQYKIGQGEEIGRPSLLQAEADYADGVVKEVRLGGCCVEVMRGELQVPEVFSKKQKAE